jgi:hypothetical protein
MNLNSLSLCFLAFKMGMTISSMTIIQGFGGDGITIIKVKVFAEFELQVYTNKCICLLVLLW